MVAYISAQLVLRSSIDTIQRFLSSWFDVWVLTENKSIQNKKLVEREKKTHHIMFYFSLPASVHAFHAMFLQSIHGATVNEWNAAL